MKTLLFVGLCFVVFSCSRYENSCRPPVFRYTFQTNKKIDTASISSGTSQHLTYPVSSGNNLVFTFVHHFKDCPDIADDEGFTKLIFEVPAGVNNFQVKDSVQLRQAKAIFDRQCFCGFAGPAFVPAGYIEGLKLNDNRWFIHAVLKGPQFGTDSLVISNEYVLE